MKPANLLVIMSDEHDPRWMGCSGSALMHTPNLDRLAARGLRFTDAYTTCPICVPARAAFAIGRYIHQIGFWDNADPYDGSVPSWHHRLREAGHRVVSVGKLHFRSADDDNGFSEEIVPMNVFEGKGDLYGLLRGDDMPPRADGKKLAALAGPGESEYTWYDREIASRAQIWLREEAPRHAGRPWVLFVSFVAPHFPLTAPPHWYYRYPFERIPTPKLYREGKLHPYVRDQADNTGYDRHFEDEAAVKRARAGYLGLISSLDENIGHLLETLEGCGLSEKTRVLYTSDHGDNLGARGLWGKQVLYEEAAKVPLILAGPGVPAGVRREPVSHVDVYPTVMECVGADAPGASGVSLLAKPTQRVILSEYHASSSRAGEFMIRHGKWKYVYFVRYPDRPELFDLENDPEELNDLGGDSRFRREREACHEELLAMLDPEEVDRRAKRRQAELVAANGGREAVIRRGSFAYSPPPGFRAEFDQ
ncbi:MAG TPA: sulfatase-like hydrolase/transferase [Burkholderiales bacterium]|nr:sulfatase-like hydrolase/transferase [Burkholderiales bacterium]